MKTAKNLLRKKKIFQEQENTPYYSFKMNRDRKREAQQMDLGSNTNPEVEL